MEQGWRGRRQSIRQEARYPRPALQLVSYPLEGGSTEGETPLGPAGALRLCIWLFVCMLLFT